MTSLQRLLREVRESPSVASAARLVSLAERHGDDSAWRVAARALFDLGAWRLRAAHGLSLGEKRTRQEDALGYVPAGRYGVVVDGMGNELANAAGGRDNIAVVLCVVENAI